MGRDFAHFAALNFWYAQAFRRLNPMRLDVVKIPWTEARTSINICIDFWFVSIRIRYTWNWTWYLSLLLLLLLLLLLVNQETHWGHLPTFKGAFLLVHPGIRGGRVVGPRTRKLKVGPARPLLPLSRRAIVMLVSDACISGKLIAWAVQRLISPDLEVTRDDRMIPWFWWFSLQESAAVE